MNDPPAGCRRTVLRSASGFKGRKWEYSSASLANCPTLDSLSFADISRSGRDSRGRVPR